MKLKRILIITSLLVLVFSIVSFSQEMTFKISMVDNAKSPLYLSGKFIADRVIELSNGQIEPKMYIDGVLSGGIGHAEVEMTQQGTINMYITSSAYLVPQEVTQSIWSLPFLFADLDQLCAFLEKQDELPVFEKINKKLERIGLKMAVYWPRSFRQLSNNKRSVTKIEDLKGLKIRTQDSQLYVDIFNLLGANAIPMATSELYTAFQLGTVDGQENCEINTYSRSWQEVQDYYTVWDYSVDLAVAVVNLSWWESLSEEDRSIIQQACYESVPYTIDYIKDNTLKYRKILEDEGMQVDIMSPEERQRAKEALEPIWVKYREIYGSELLDEFLDALKSI
ncbi:MAG: TRAP transporter substrate-binding protein [Eubacteriaceae bacterium]